MNRLTVPPLGWGARLTDRLIVPLMYLVSGTFRESPQKTHRWNNHKLNPAELEGFSEALMVLDRGLPGEASRWYGKLPIFHLPVLGGWKKYIVLSPQTTGTWHVGWWSDDVAGVTRLPLEGPVRMLIGPLPTKFFGVDEEGKQTPLTKIGEGVVGREGPFACVPLL